MVVFLHDSNYLTHLSPSRLRPLPLVKDQLAAKLAAPLTALGGRFEWSPDAQASFDALKLALSSASVLRTLDQSQRAVLTADASNVAVAPRLFGMFCHGELGPAAGPGAPAAAAAGFGAAGPVVPERDCAEHSEATVLAFYAA